MIVVKEIVDGVPTWKLPAASSDAKIVAAEAKTIYDNMPGMSYEVQAVDKLYYFVHNETKPAGWRSVPDQLWSCEACRGYCVWRDCRR